MSTKEFKAFWVTEQERMVFNRSLITRKISDLPDNDILVKVKYSALNYKDVLSATGNKGITRQYPHTPGIDASGIIEASNNPEFKVGDEVIVTSYDLGMNTPGGFGEYISVPASWLVPKPKEISLYESMILGTAGFTAALAIFKMEQSGQKPENGPVLVTGASGGVGSFAVAFLSNLNYNVIASTSKYQERPYLENLGAKSFVTKGETIDDSSKKLLKPRWAGAIDVLGGKVLETAVKACKNGGNIAVCGNVYSPDFELSVYPFILNGVNLLGVESATCPMELRLKVWDKIAKECNTKNLTLIARTIRLDQLDNFIQLMKEGKIKGRTVIEHD